jgi:hypothetical protein
MDDEKGTRDTRAEGITFLLTGEGAPEPFLAYEAEAIVLEIPEGSPDPIDALVNLYLEKGFELLTGPLAGQTFPTLPGWTLKADERGVTLWDDLGVIMFTAGRGKIEDEWAEIVNERAWCRVLTGTDLGVGRDDFFQAVDEAIAGGRVVAATVAAAASDRPHPDI